MLVGSGCDRTHDTAPGRPVDEIRFRRTGGGAAEFFVTKSPEGILVDRVKREDSSTDVRIMLNPRDWRYDDFEFLKHTFDGTIPLTGKTPRESRGATGTWYHADARMGEKWIKITNQEVLALVRSIETELRLKHGL